MPSDRQAAEHGCAALKQPQQACAKSCYCRSGLRLPAFTALPSAEANLYVFLHALERLIYLRLCRLLLLPVLLRLLHPPELLSSAKFPRLLTQQNTPAPGTRRAQRAALQQQDWPCRSIGCTALRKHCHNARVRPSSNEYKTGSNKRSPQTKEGEKSARRACCCLAAARSRSTRSFSCALFFSSASFCFCACT